MAGADRFRRARHSASSSARWCSFCWRRAPYAQSIMPGLVQRAAVPEDNPHPILRIAPSGEVRYANAAANALTGTDRRRSRTLGAVAGRLAEMRGTGRTERRFEDRRPRLSIERGHGFQRLPQPLRVRHRPISSPRSARSARVRRASRLVTRTARLGLFEIDVPKRTITYNDIYAWQLGIGPVSYTESLDLWAERDPSGASARRPCARCRSSSAAGSGATAMEHRLDNGRGGWIWVSAIAEVTEIEPTGMPRQIIGSHLDVTELRHPEVALARNNRRSQAQLELVTLGESGSESALACAAQHAASITESPRAVIHVLDDKGEVEADLSVRPERPSAAHERSAARERDPRQRPGRCAADRGPGGRPPTTRRIAGSLQIIGTEAWRLVQRIRQARKLEIQSRVLQSAVNGIVITDPEGRVEWANPAFEQITGYTLDELTGHDLKLLRSGDHDESFYRRLWDTISDGRSFNGEFTYRRKDGSLVTVEQVITPVVGAGGQIEKFISVSEDITERKTVEKSAGLSPPARRADGLAQPRQHGRCDRPGDRRARARRPGLRRALCRPRSFQGGQRPDRPPVEPTRSLQRVAVTLNDCLRPTDNVARCGGDEFVVLQRMAKSADDAANPGAPACHGARAARWKPVRSKCGSAPASASASSRPTRAAPTSC